VSRQRADLGAYQNRFEMASKGVAIASENLTAAESRIRDVDMASEMVNYMKNQILTQSATAMLAQANTKTQSVLQLL
jgi:flagellin